MVCFILPPRELIGVKSLSVEAVPQADAKPQKAQKTKTPKKKKADKPAEKKK